MLILKWLTNRRIRKPNFRIRTLRDSRTYMSFFMLDIRKQMPYYDRDKKGKLNPCTKDGKLDGYLIVSTSSPKLFAMGFPRFRCISMDKYFDGELSYRELNEYATDKGIFLGGTVSILVFMKEDDYSRYFSQYEQLTANIPGRGVILPIVKSKNVNCLLNKEMLVGYTLIKDEFGRPTVQTMQCGLKDMKNGGDNE